jgi:WD40 repeat protein
VIFLCVNINKCSSQAIDTLSNSSTLLNTISVQINENVLVKANKQIVEFVTNNSVERKLKAPAIVTALNWAKSTLIAGTENGNIILWQVSAQNINIKTTINTGFNSPIQSLTFSSSKIYFSNLLGSYLLDTSLKTFDGMTVPACISTDVITSFTTIGDTAIFGIKNNCMYKILEEKIYLQKLPVMLADSCTIQFDTYGNKKA